MKGIYIHIPFCKQKCKYCDFVSYANMEYLQEEYISALIKEAEQYRGEKADTVFIGGGTPSVLSAVQIKRLADMCFEVFDLQQNCEFTMELNPGTLNNEKIRAMLEGGVNRVSVGVQSFSDGELTKIGRIHDAKTAYDTVETLNKAGFSNISIDLMTALPGQTPQSLMNTLKTACELPVSHISAYGLIIEKGTRLEKEYSMGELNLPDEDTDRDMYANTIEFLQEKGFFQYEISNFAKLGCECRHNIKYWTGEEYIGLGAAAHSYMNGKRFYNVSDVRGYINGAEKEVILLSDNDRIAEFMITGLRITRGISEKTFFECFGMPLTAKFGTELERFIKLGLMSYDSGYYRLTREGINVSNSILCEFV